MRRYRCSLRALRRALPSLALWPLLGGCAEQMQEMAVRIHNLETRVKELDEAHGVQERRVDEVESELTQAWSSIFCGERLVQMFDDIDKECSKQPAAAAPASTPPVAAQTAPDTAGASCNTKSIAPAVVDADDSHKGMFLSVMRIAPSEVIPIPSGSKELSQHRIKKLEHLAQTRLRTTRFLVVARTMPKEPNAEIAAAMRTRMVAEHLQKWKVPEELIRRWTYSFPMSKQDMTKYQSQLRPGEPSDVNLGVWVFRVNC